MMSEQAREASVCALHVSVGSRGAGLGWGMMSRGCHWLLRLAAQSRSRRRRLSSWSAVVPLAGGGVWWGACNCDAACQELPGDLSGYRLVRVRGLRCSSPQRSASRARSRGDGDCVPPGGAVEDVDDGLVTQAG